MNQKIDYIVVGLGIAGISICEELEKNNKSYVVYDDGDTTSTLVSAGVINPIVLKRFTPVWNAKKHVETSIQFYKNLSKKLGITLFKEMPMLRVFKSIEEQNNWVVASDKNELSPYLQTEIIKNKNQSIHAPYGYGKVLSTGVVDTVLLIKSFKGYLQKNNLLKNEKFDYDQLQEKESTIRYQNYISKRILFSEGASVRNNPFFPPPPVSGSKHLLIPNKGEYIIIKAPNLKLHAMLKSSLFVIPLENDLYKVGATYSRDNFTVNTTKEARQELASKLDKMINCDFEIVDQVAGIRPTTKDRRPFLGTLKESELKVFYNGLGTRGITAAPSLPKELYLHLENNEELDKEIDINRYYKW